MRKKIYTYLVLLLLCLVCGSCEKALMNTKAETSKQVVFEELWKVIDQKYSYFELKGIDWDAIGEQYAQKVNEELSTLEFFSLMSDMLYELQDGHVNLISGFDYSRNWEWYLGYPSNFDYEVVHRNYLGSDYWITGGLENTLLDRGRFGYIYYESFSSSMNNIDLVLSRFNRSAGLIIDIRNNGGGSLSNARDLAARFSRERLPAYKTYHKRGPGHEDFTDAFAQDIIPRGYYFDKPVVVLTNRSCFSAASFFAVMMKCCPRVTVMGDPTGGGAGLPVDYLLSNGWKVRFSASRSIDNEQADFEMGVEPDIVLPEMDKEALLRGQDSYIEAAKDFILRQYP